MDDISNPLVPIGVVFCIIGTLMFCIGKKWIIFRWLLNDRSMFSQIVYGSIIFLIGLVLLFISGTFTA